MGRSGEETLRRHKLAGVPFVPPLPLKVDLDHPLDERVHDSKARAAEMDEIAGMRSMLQVLPQSLK